MVINKKYFWQNGSAIEGEKVTLPYEGKWEYTWSNLPKYANGEEITYTIKELKADGTAVENNGAFDKNYTATYAVVENETTITN